MFRWVQLPLEEVKEMEENGEIEEGLGHRYQDPRTKWTWSNSMLTNTIHFKTDRTWGQLECQKACRLETINLLWTG
jgi:hypothetical protein